MLQKDSPVHDVPRDHLCDAYLPAGVHSHDVKLTNAAEQWNWMSMAAREEESKFRSMQAVVALLESRQQTLSEKVHIEKAKHAPAGTLNSDLAGLPWSETAATPRMQEMNELQRVKSLNLQEPSVCVGSSDVEGGSEVHLVQSESNPKVYFRVNLQAMEDGRYDEACSCGMSSSGLSFCKHVKRTIRKRRLMWGNFVKPWQRPSAWQEAVGEPWEPIDHTEIVATTRQLAEAGQLRRLKAPSVAITPKGATSNSETSKWEGRVKSFLEDLGTEALAEDTTRRVMSGHSGMPRTFSGEVECAELLVFWSILC